MKKARIVFLHPPIFILSSISHRLIRPTTPDDYSVDTPSLFPGVGIAESTCGSRTAGWALGSPSGHNLWGIDELSRVALER
jgi:hypothetical protein